MRLTEQFPQFFKTINITQVKKKVLGGGDKNIGEQPKK